MRAASFLYGLGCQRRPARQSGATVSGGVPEANGRALEVDAYWSQVESRYQAAYSAGKIPGDMVAKFNTAKADWDAYKAWFPANLVDETADQIQGQIEAYGAEARRLDDELATEIAVPPSSTPPSSTPYTPPSSTPPKAPPGGRPPAPNAPPSSTPASTTPASSTPSGGGGGGAGAVAIAALLGLVLLGRR